MSGIEREIEAAIRAKIADADVTATQNKGGHYAISVVSKEFEGKNMVMVTAGGPGRFHLFVRLTLAWQQSCIRRPVNETSLCCLNVSNAV